MTAVALTTINRIMIASAAPPDYDYLIEDMNLTVYDAAMVQMRHLGLVYGPDDAYTKEAIKRCVELHSLFVSSAPDAG